ncbi:hypothetical protein OE749_14750 [Aestuariibacter sp. AA17]|uniref:Uncharacterized protein n=1 Tax=Fluctibacter corallii TaxID=2984329 RepID=A0ABT3AB91_9ALTE|nr:hypothetical protein [Aestuariibacter sp. AA17]MCV2885949.1 hypothetical protein [Aestuariibacter sp. AA17]
MENLDTSLSSQTRALFSQMHKTLLKETLAMAEFALSNGKLPDPVQLEQINAIMRKDALDEKDVAVLGNIHKYLSRLIAPAIPQSILLLQTQRKSRHPLSFLGPVPLIRQLMCLNFVFLLVFIATGMTPSVNYISLNKGILASSGGDLLINIGFLMSCAGLGAGFAALYQLNQYIGNVNYDPKYDSTYWTKIVLGVIAGLFLVELLPQESFHSQTQAADGDILYGSLLKPTLALLGGFSASMVYRILNRMVESLESLVKGDQASTLQSKTQLLEAKAYQNQFDTALQVLSAVKEIEKHVSEDDKQKAQEAIELLAERVAPQAEFTFNR